jgi:tRNA dimethylallyltransferase
MLPVADCWFLTGPTAVGKSDVGVELARTIGAEIISMDSMALYRGMDIGTAKPTPTQRSSVPHHLIDAIDPREEFSLAQYLAAAHRCIEDIKSRGREVLFVGGTPLYLKGLLRGIFEGPPADPDLRARLRREAGESGSQALHLRLNAVDPAAAARLHPNDTRRLIRALEVYEKTGRPISSLQRQFEVGRPAGECRVFVLDRPREELHQRIERRVDEMFAAGLLDEVRGLLAIQKETAREKGTVPFSGHHACMVGENWDSPRRMLSRTALQAVGYREAIEFLEGKRSLTDTVVLVKQRTRQLAKRQATWLRSLVECRFVRISGEISAQTVAAQIAQDGFTG